jgi:hypothetical protein
MRDGELFTRQQALAAGHHDRELTTLVRSGQISRVARGVYRIGDAPLPDPEATVKALRAVMSHASAAAWYGAALAATPDRLHVTTPRERGRRIGEVPGVRIHRAHLVPREVTRVRGPRVTSPLRTALDVARCLPTPEAVATLDSMCRLMLLRPADALAAALQLPPAPGRQHALTAAQLIDVRAESVFESMNRVSMVLAGLPTPTPQLNVCDRDGRWIARVDFGWTKLRVILECDGYEFHHDRDAFERDRRRWTALTRAGWKVVVVTWRSSIEDPSYLIDVMADLLGTGC